MLNKLNQLSVAAYVKTSAFFRGLKSDERGLSGVVVAVLLILVAFINFLAKSVANVLQKRNRG